MEKKFQKKAFTLIEMLIVIVIIWVLAAALIPRLTSVRDRANDVARKADLNQIATAVIARQMDNNGKLPWENDVVMPANAIEAELVQAWLDSIPQDPKTDAQVSWLWSWVITWWQYAYMKVYKNWISNSSFAVMAKMETPGASNRLYSGGATDLAGWLIASDTETTEITPCKSVTKLTQTQIDAWSWFDLVPGGECYFTNYDQLRFMIVR